MVMESSNPKSDEIGKEVEACCGRLHALLVRTASEEGDLAAAEDAYMIVAMFSFLADAWAARGRQPELTGEKANG